MLQLLEQGVSVREQPLVLRFEAARPEERVSSGDAYHVSWISSDQDDIGKWVFPMNCATFCNAPSTTTILTDRVNLVYNSSS